MEIMEERRPAALSWRCWGLLERMRSPFPPPQGACGAFLGILGRKIVPQGHLGEARGVPGGILDPSWGVQGGLGTLLGGLGAILGGLGGVLGGSWGGLVQSWGYLGAS